MSDNTPATAPTGPTFADEMRDFAILSQLEKDAKEQLAQARAGLTAKYGEKFLAEGISQMTLMYAQKPLAKSSLSLTGDTYEVEDDGHPAPEDTGVKVPDSLLTYVEENHPTEVVTVYIAEQRVRESFLKVLLAKGLVAQFDDEGEPILGEDGKQLIVDKAGVPVPGVKFTKGGKPKSFSITSTPEQKARMLEIAKGGYTYDALKPPAQIEADVIIDEGAPAPAAPAASFVGDAEGNIVDAEVVDDDGPGVAA